jgi:hypothetical protein
VADKPNEQADGRKRLAAGRFPHDARQRRRRLWCSTARVPPQTEVDGSIPGLHGRCSRGRSSLPARSGEEERHLLASLSPTGAEPYTWRTMTRHRALRRAAATAMAVCRRARAPIGSGAGKPLPPQLRDADPHPFSP